jgi:hypothetical protein
MENATKQMKQNPGIQSDIENVEYCIRAENVLGFDAQ